MYYSLLNSSSLVAPYAEMCGEHGLVLARGRPKKAKQLSAALVGLPKWLRVAKNSSDLENALRQVVLNAPRFVWRQDGRSAAERECAEILKEHSFGDAEVLWTKQRGCSDANAPMTKSPFHHDLDALLACVSSGLLGFPPHHGYEELGFRIPWISPVPPTFLPILIAGM